MTQLKDSCIECTEPVSSKNLACCTISNQLQCGESKPGFKDLLLKYLFPRVNNSDIVSLKSAQNVDAACKVFEPTFEGDQKTASPWFVAGMAFAPKRRLK